MATLNLSERLRIWEQLATQLALRLAEVPHLQAQHEALVARTTAIKFLQDERPRHQSALARTQEDLQMEVFHAGETYSALSESLRAFYGRRNKELVAFGLRPRRLTAKARAAIIEATAPNASAASTPPPAPAPPAPSAITP
ncbi:MAG: hypothetical protein ABJC13_09475 [Acidobacteriota bacterium]